MVGGPTRSSMINDLIPLYQVSIPLIKQTNIIQNNRNYSISSLEDFKKWHSGQ